MSPTFEALSARLDACAWRLGRGDLVSGAELQALADATLAAASTLADEERLLLVARVDAVARALQSATQDVGERLGQVRQGRRVVRRYQAAGAG